jgi:hypothetical protein
MKEITMEYEHNWSYSRRQPAYRSAWPGLVRDTRTILRAVSAAGIHLAGPAGLVAPVADDRVGIVFNGDAHRSEHGQTFLLRPPAVREGSHGPMSVVDSCRTDQLPYDVAVTAVLLRFKLLLPHTFTVLSDGHWNREWACGTRAQQLSARTLVGDLFGDHPIHTPLA